MTSEAVSLSASAGEVGGSPGPPPAEALWPLLAGVQSTQLVYVAAKLGLADALGSRPRTVGRLARAVRVDRSVLARVLDGLAANGIVRKRSDGRYELSALGEHLRIGAPGCMRDWAIVAGELHYPAWGSLVGRLRPGTSASRDASTTEVWDRLGESGALNEAFRRVTNRVSEEIAPSLVRAFDLDPGSVVVDVGGGQGALLASVLRAIPSARGILLDRPRVLEGARPLLDAQGLLERCEIVAGDFFASVPRGGDVYLLKDVLHDWDDASCQCILRRIRDAIQSGGRLLVVEILADADLPWLVELDLQLLVVAGGRKRSADVYRDLLAVEGFDVASVTALEVPGWSVVEAVAMPA